MSVPKKVLFIDRDGTLILETADEQIDSFAKLEFYPGALTWLPRIAKELDFELAMVTNQDGLGTASYSEESFNSIQNFVLKTFENEGVKFINTHVDRTYAKDNAPTRKPGVGLLGQYFDIEKYDLKNSFTIGDRKNDILLAKNLGAKSIWLNNHSNLGGAETQNNSDIQGVVALETTDWKAIYEFLKLGERVFEGKRVTKETDIY